MPKTTYIAIDPAGGKHTRSTVRVYSHAVVFRLSYEHMLAEASAKHQPQQDRRRWEYYSKMASGNDRYSTTNYRAEQPDKWTPEQIAERQLQVDAGHAERKAGAIEKLAGRDIGRFLLDEPAARIAYVEKLKAEGYFERWQSAGWCSHLEQAQKLAGGERARASVAEAVVLEANSV